MAAMQQAADSARKAAQVDGEWCIDAVARLMEDDKPRTALEVSVELGRPRKTVQRALNLLSEAGPMQVVHVQGKRGQTLVYVNGSGVNVAFGGRHKAGRPEGVPPWWVPADGIAEEAMRAMVRCGSVTLH